MDYCKYHPLEPATYNCPECSHDACDTCVEENYFREDVQCFLCQSTMSSLGSANNAEPFWRRLDKSFRYPLNANALTLIVGVSFLNTVLMFIPLTFIWQIMLTGAMVSYCFACLKQTASGKLVAPDIKEAYEGGVNLLVKLFAILLIYAVSIGLISAVAGIKVMNIAAMLAVITFPASIILLALSNSLLASINPVGQFRLIISIGLPYGLILAFIMIMTGSVGLISEVIGSQFDLITLWLQATVSNYYIVVVFHIMGYMIFQYQAELGFAARANSGERREERSDEEKTKHRIDLLLKEGRFEVAFNELAVAARKYPQDPDFSRLCFEFIHESRNGRYIAEFGSLYLDQLVKKRQDQQLKTLYRRILQIESDFQPDKPETRHQLARVLRQSGDTKSAIKLLNRLHKDFPEYKELADAYEFMAECLAELPNMQKQVDQYRQFANKLSRTVGTRKEPDPKAEQ